MSIICEIGISHGGSMPKAKELIRLAKENGASMVKSQLYNAEDDKDKPYYQESKDAELTFEQAKELFDYAESIGIEMFYSVFAPEYVAWCKNMKCKHIKVACQMRDYETWRQIYFSQIPAIVSVPFDRSVDTWPYGIQAQTIYCVPEYPAKPESIPFAKYDLQFSGWSDHCIGIDYARIAIARGAKTIEKHFAFGHDAREYGVDAPWSMDVLELRELVAWEKVCQSVLA